MKQEEKDLLLKDLCTRLPYGVKVESVFINPDTKEHKSCGIEVFDATNLLMIRDGLGEFKPYLFPLSSITEEQAKELFDIFGLVCPSTEEDYIKINECTGITFFLLQGFDVETHLDKLIDWLNKNHFDYRGLIEKGLALDATNKNIY